jgi:hypothetical protein
VTPLNEFEPLAETSGILNLDMMRGELGMSFEGGRKNLGRGKEAGGKREGSWWEKGRKEREIIDNNGWEIASVMSEMTR